MSQLQDTLDALKYASRNLDLEAIDNEVMTWASIAEDWCVTDPDSPQANNAAELHEQLYDVYERAETLHVVLEETEDLLTSLIKGGFTR